MRNHALPDLLHLPFGVHAPCMMPASKLVDVALQLPRRQVTVGAIEASLQERPERLNAIRVCHAIHILFRRVLDGFMLVAFECIVGGGFIREDH